MAEPLPELAIKLENSDVGEIFKNKINQLIDELNLNRTEFNQQLIEAGLAEDFANASKDYRDAAQQYANDAQTITESGLPPQANQAGKALMTDGLHVFWVEVLPTQAGNKHRRLVSNGTQVSWQFDGVFTRYESTASTLEPGDSVLITAIDTLIEARLPTNVVQGQPFTVRNSLKSNSNVRVLNADHTLYDKNDNYAPGENPVLVPGEQINLIALSDTELEVL